MSNERKAVLQYGVDMEAGTITFNVLGAGSVTLMLEQTSEETRQAALYNGFKQAGGDKAAIPRDAKTGRSASPSEKFAAVREWVEHLNAGGSWTLRQASRMLNRACLFAAIATVRGASPERVAAKFGSFEDKVLQSFLQHRDIAAEYSRLVAPSESKAADEMLRTLKD